MPRGRNGVIESHDRRKVEGGLENIARITHVTSRGQTPGVPREVADSFQGELRLFCRHEETEAGIGNSTGRSRNSASAAHFGSK
jgi:hypothetical protein